MMMQINLATVKDVEVLHRLDHHVSKQELLNSIHLNRVFIAKEQGEFGAAFAIAAILMILTVLINMAATMDGKYFTQKKNL